MRVTISITILMITAKIMNGRVKQHFLNLAAKSPRRPVTTEKSPARMAKTPNKANGDGNYVSPSSQVSSIPRPK